MGIRVLVQPLEVKVAVYIFLAHFLLLAIILSCADATIERAKVKSVAISSKNNFKVCKGNGCKEQRRKVTKMTPAAKPKKGKIVTYTTKRITVRTARWLEFNMTLRKKLSTTTTKITTKEGLPVTSGSSTVAASSVATTINAPKIVAASSTVVASTSDGLKTTQTSTAASSTVTKDAPATTVAATSAKAAESASTVAAATTAVPSTTSTASPTATTTAKYDDVTTTASGSQDTTASTKSSTATSSTTTAAAKETTAAAADDSSSGTASMAGETTTVADGSGTTKNESDTPAAVADDSDRTQTTQSDDGTTNNSSQNNGTTAKRTASNVQCKWMLRECMEDSALASAFKADGKNDVGALATLKTSGKQIFLSTGVLKYGIETNIYDYCCSLGMKVFEPATVADFKDYYELATNAKDGTGHVGLIGEVYKISGTNKLYCSSNANFPVTWPKYDAFAGKGYFMVFTEMKNGAPMFATKIDQILFKSSDGLQKSTSLSGVTYFACQK